MTTEFRDRYGPVALVTGASSGIGRAFARRLAALGFDLVLVARRVDRLDRLAAELHDAHATVVTNLAIDLSAPDAAARIISATDSIDIGLVVSNAGFGMKGDHAANDPNAMTGMLAVNCAVPMLLAHGFAPRLRARGRGGIILTSSVEGLIGCPYSTAYAASKAFVIALGEGLWGELTPDGIDVLTICPGATDTEAAALQGIDPATLRNVMPPEDVVERALANITHGPTVVTSDHYRATFDHMLSLPRRETLTMMAAAMKR